MALKHLVMMRLQPGVFTEEAEQEYRETFAALQAALPEDILSVRVERNVVERPQNMTVLVEMLLKGEASLPLYLRHPLHQAIGAKYNPAVEAIASFDSWMEEAGEQA
ncbi:MAG: Dabb family protein [Clostridia bacterium]|nr:Dabb family protein [Clostridia bacterium]